MCPHPSTWCLCFSLLLPGVLGGFLPAALPQRWPPLTVRCSLDPTAFFSFPQSAYRVNLGEHRLSNPSPSLVSSPVRQILVHPDYKRGTRAADIALVQLAEPVRYTEKILPVCLPGPSDSFPENHMCWVTGSGPADQLCNALYNIDPAPNIGRDHIKPNMICAGYAEGQRDSCQGDSGGLLACDHNWTWFLMGVVSWGDGCGQPNCSRVYVRTVAYGEWIWGHVVSGGQATSMENSISEVNDARSSFSTYTLLFTTLLMSL
uniref:Peptidase S1 domain-containing protein n=1 Tax=Gopherus evgoodei TaxID=1825980 RepID=A0A8C4WMQ7_9SAUR